MTTSQFEKLKNFKTASFALWNPEYEKFQDAECIKKNIKSLHARVIILGLNPSREINFLKNFHKGRYDHWYAEAFKEEPFRGAYMTDLISHHESDAKKIISKWRKDESFRKSNIENLKEQLEILKVRNPVIVCIGKCTDLLLKQCEKFLFENIYPIKHPNGYREEGRREKFIKDVEKLGRIIKTTK